ncbi:Class iii chitinase protein [Lasiodiplodia theobromae]|uniref:Class iii chitinase protein n=1 Tax=Lasiodiplodia theobromae TaxID=45133 RepID=UPI0015C30148|nr:Class iii chitinase protein [Lasiodiplodia theobromae]KAF4541896.1 Class iii chitinase protein [Lasiodiplodia theobromae]
MPPTPPPPPPPADLQEQQQELLDSATHPLPRFILYAQTHHKPGPEPQEPVSLLPLLTHCTGVTHIIIAAIHLNDGPGNITLNDHRPDHSRFDTLWAEVRQLQDAGVKVMGMLGGAAKGSYWRLQGSAEEFEAYYTPLRDLVRHHHLDGLDLDVEEAIELPTILRLLTRLRADFGPSFITTLAPVSTALIPDMQLPPFEYVPLDPSTGAPTAGAPPLTIPRSLPHLSGFNHFALEAGHGGLVSWYNTQFYNGWGDASNPALWEAIAAAGWAPRKLVLGVLTNQGNGGSGYVATGVLEAVVRELRAKYPPPAAATPQGVGSGANRTFAGVMGWEYFNAGGTDGFKPWEWAKRIGRAARSSTVEPWGAQSGSGLAGAGAGAEPPVPWPEQVKQLMELGFARPNAVAALNATDGNVEMAAGLLFEQ